MRSLPWLRPSSMKATTFAMAAVRLRLSSQVLPIDYQAAVKHSSPRKHL